MRENPYSEPPEPTKEMQALKADVDSLLKSIGMIDDNPFNKPQLKESLLQAITTKKLSLFSLECIASYPEASENEVGKAPVEPNSNFAQYSTAMAARDPISHLVKNLHSDGIAVNFHIFLGDDDYIHSVDHQWSLDNPQIVNTITQQKKFLETQLPSEYGLLKTNDTLTVHSWNELENSSPRIIDTRNKIKNYLKLSLDGEAKLPGPILNLFQYFIEWRKQISAKSGSGVSENHIRQLAIEELISFATQGCEAPSIVQNLDGGQNPIININTYPSFKFPSDICIRLGGQWVGLSQPSFATIHPSSDTLDQKLQRISGISIKPSKTTTFACGDPKGNPNYR